MAHLYRTSEYSEPALAFWMDIDEELEVVGSDIEGYCYPFDKLHPSHLDETRLQPGQNSQVSCVGPFAQEVNRPQDVVLGRSFAEGAREHQLFGVHAEFGDWVRSS